MVPHAGWSRCKYRANDPCGHLVDHTVLARRILRVVRDIRHHQCRNDVSALVSLDAISPLDILVQCHALLNKAGVGLLSLPR
jgi:hypothetical protein